MKNQENAMNTTLLKYLLLLLASALATWGQPAMPGGGPGGGSPMGSELPGPARTATATRAAAPEAAQPPAAASDIVLEFPDESPTVGSAAFAADETISVDFPDEEIRTILRNVADLYDLNLVIPDTLAGRTSIKLRNVSWKEVFDVILEPIQFTYVEDRNIIKIKSLEELALEPMDTRVFLVNFAAAGTLQDAVSILVDTAAGGRIQVDTRSNALVITERPSRMNNIQEIIDRLDRPTEQVKIESKFVEVSNSNLKDLGINWSSLGGYEINTGGMAISREREDTDGLVTTTTTEITNVLDLESFGLVLSMLETLDDVKLVSNPTVVTLNNTAALISIGERYPVPQYTYNDERGTFEVSGFEYQDIGINLTVTPQVNSAGFINLDIKPEVSTRQGSVNFGGASGAEIPIVGSRRTETNITIKDGYTLAIGGLVESSSNNDVIRVPYLSNIPGLGKLFKDTTDQMVQRNLIIFITAKTLNPDGSTYRDIIDPRVFNDLRLTERDVPGYQVGPAEAEMMRRIEQRRKGFFDQDALNELQHQLDRASSLDNFWISRDKRDPHMTAP